MNGVAEIAADENFSVPPALSISPINVVVVLLPLVPVTATKGARKNRYANSISLSTGIPLATAS